jgi:FMN reductase
MTASTTTGGVPLVVGLGGTLRANSSTERALRYCLDSVEAQGGRTKFFSGPDLDLPMYAPHELKRTPKALELVGALRDADAVVVGSPGYHGAVSGLLKNALDYIEDLREDPRAYLDNTPHQLRVPLAGGGWGHWASCAISATRCGHGQPRWASRSTLPTRSGIRQAN